MFDTGTPPTALLQRVCSAVRAEACAAAERLVAIGDLVALRITQSGETHDWAADATDAATADIAAALSISHQLASSHVRYARALREQLPALGRAFIAGDIDEATFRICVFRTGLITDPDILTRVDHDLALAVPRWGTTNRSQFASRIDTIVGRADTDAVRRRRDRIADREVYVGDVDNGLAEIHATVYATDAHAFADRLTPLAATVCPNDPRTTAQRRADATGAMASHADRLACRCARTDCCAGPRPASAVVIHVIADHTTVHDTATPGADTPAPGPATMIGYEGLLPAELVADLAQSARLRPLHHPTDTEPEPGYTPSRTLADFVRCRDLTCRFPGCSRPATASDIDHTVPHRDGGPTHASNLKCLCRLHHLIKTFWGWHDRQLPDGTIIWTSPTGDTYVTTPGSALLFPTLTAPTPPAGPTRTRHPATVRSHGDRTAKMPRRHRTREKQRAADIADERRHNHHARTTPPPPPPCDDTNIDYADTFTKTPDPPPF